MSKKTIAGLSRLLFNIQLRLSTFFSLIPRVLNKEFTWAELFRFISDSSYVMSFFKENKFVRVGDSVKMDLYIPGFPSPAFESVTNRLLKRTKQLPGSTVLISVTSACKFRCEYCYQKNDKGKDVSINLLIDAVKKTQNAGISFFVIQGGEPFLAFDRLEAVCHAIDERSEIWINATGAGMTAEKLAILKNLNVKGVMFSLHSPDKDKFNTFLGRDDAWDCMEQGVDLCRKADMGIAFNVCLFKESFFNGDFQKIMELSKEYNGAFIQLISPKPAGGNIDSQAEIVSPEEEKVIKSLINTYNRDSRYREYPSIWAQIIKEDKSVFGCIGGGNEKFYINSKGDVQPCEFLNVSFGNIKEEPFEDIHRRMREHFDIPRNCLLCIDYARLISDVIKENAITEFPLNKKLSDQVFNTWDRGAAVDFYKKLQKQEKKD